MNKKLILGGGSLLALSLFLAAGSALAADGGWQKMGQGKFGMGKPGMHMKMMGGPGGILGNHFPGSVTAINGSTFTLETKGRLAKTLTVNTAGAAITKNGQPASLADIGVGQMVVVEGKLDSAGATLTAEKVNIVIPMPSIRLEGTVQSVSGSTFSVLANNGATYSVDATSAKIFSVPGGQGTMSQVQAGDKVMVMGMILSSNNQITAQMVMDRSK